MFPSVVRSQYHTSLCSRAGVRAQYKSAHYNQTRRVLSANSRAAASLYVEPYVGVAVAADRQSCCLDEVESACAGADVDMLPSLSGVFRAIPGAGYTLFLLDTLDDKVGFAGAFRVLIVVPLLPVMALAVHTAENLRSKGATEDAAPANSADPEGGVALANRLSGTGTEDANGTSERGDSTSENPLHSP
jgi:hypothetical protein